MASSICAADQAFQRDVDFLRKHTETIVLGKEDAGPRIAVVPAYQGRVMTSTTGGDSQPSFGWINYDAHRVRQVDAAYQRVRRRGAILAGARGGAV